MSVLADYKFEIDWNNDKDFGEAYENISTDVTQANWRTGFNGPFPDKANAGSLTLTVRNPTGKYTDTNPNSPIVATYGSLRTGVRTRASMSLNGGIDWVVMWQGFLDTITPTTGNETLEGGTAEISALGPFSRMATGDVNIALKEQISTCDAADQLLDAINWPAGERQMDIGQSTLYKWWVRNELAPLDALRELESAELGRLWESKDGKVVFDDRHHIFDAPHASYRVLYGVGGLDMWEPSLPNTKATVYNAYRGNQRTFNLSDDVALVTLVDQPNGQGGKPLEIGPFKTITVWMELNAQNTPDNYIAVYEWGSAGTGLDCFIYDNPVSQAGTEITDDFTIDRDDFGPKMRVIITNTSGTTGYVTTLIAYGVAVVETDPIAIKVDDPDSQEIFGVCEYPEPDPWCTDFADGYDMAQYLVDATSSEGGILAYPRTQVQFTLKANVDDAHLLEAQTIDINERIHIKDDDSEGSVYGLYCDADFVIDSLEHSIDNVGRFHTVLVKCTIAPDHEFGPTDTQWSGNITPPEPGTLVPDGLSLITVDPARTVVVGLSASKNNETIDQAELRFYYTTTVFGTSVDLRLQSEGGQFVPNGTTRLDLLLAANASGVNYQFNTGNDITGRGRWWVAGRLHNKAGWSNWTDGNPLPTTVTRYISMADFASGDVGPASGSVVTAQLFGNAVQPKVTRPPTNGNVIFWVCAQVRDGGVAGPESANDWYDLDADSGPAETKYDGSGNNATYNKQTGAFMTIDGWGTAQAGDLLLMDVRCNGSFDVNWCQWGTLTEDPSGNYLGGLPGFRPMPTPDVPEWLLWTSVRVKVVKPPWAWDTYGYIKDGFCWQTFVGGPEALSGDLTTHEFLLPPITIPDGLINGDIHVRAWVENKVCRGFVGQTEVVGIVDEGNPQGAHGLQIIFHTTDPAVPDGMMAFRFYRDTFNYQNIYTVAFWASSTLPAKDFFDAGRDVNVIYESGTCDTTDDSTAVTITRAADPDVIGKQIVFWTEDATPDSDLFAEIVKAEGLNSITLYSPIHKTGTWNYAIVDPCWDLPTTGNLGYYQFSVPSQIGGSIEATQWQTTPVPALPGVFWVTGCSRNQFGVGTKMTANSVADAGGQLGCQQIALVTAPSGGEAPYSAYTVAGGTDVYYIDAELGSFTLENPTGQLYCGRPFCWIIKQPSDSDASQPSEVYFGDKFRFCDEIQAVTLSATPGATDYLGAIYFLPWDKFKIVALVHNFQENP